MVAAKLAHHKIPVADLHAAADKRDRKQAMDDIRSGRVLVLITSDVGARGLDIAGVANIVNFDVPTQSKAYLHRVGRTARAGAKGWATTLMTADEVRLVSRFESELGIVMHRVRLREGQVIPAGAEGVAGPPEPR
jgi:superfamily II DNA/RNA helicase